MLTSPTLACLNQPYSSSMSSLDAPGSLFATSTARSNSSWRADMLGLGGRRGMDADEVKWMKNTKLEERKEQVKILETSKYALHGFSFQRS